MSQLTLLYSGFRLRQIEIQTNLAEVVSIHIKLLDGVSEDFFGVEKDYGLFFWRADIYQDMFWGVYLVEVREQYRVMMVVCKLLLKVFNLVNCNTIVCCWCGTNWAGWVDTRILVWLKWFWWYIISLGCGGWWNLNSSGRDWTFKQNTILHEIGWKIYRL